MVPDCPGWSGIVQNHPGSSRIVWNHLELSAIVRNHPKLSEIIHYWLMFFHFWQSNFIKLFDGGLQCEFIRTFFEKFPRYQPASTEKRVCANKLFWCWKSWYVGNFSLKYLNEHVLVLPCSMDYFKISKHWFIWIIFYNQVITPRTSALHALVT